MKKLLKKKVNVFGKGIPVFAIVILGIALVGAALAPYLSGMVTGNVSVESPMLTGISTGEGAAVDWATAQCYRSSQEPIGMVDCYPAKSHTLDDWTTGETPLQLPVMYTGQEKTFTLYLMSANVAPDTNITGFEEIIVTNLEGVTCNDFASVKVRVDSIYGDLGYGGENNALEICVNGTDPNEVKFDSEQFGTAGLSTWGAGETDVSEIVVTFNNVIGTYTFTYQVIPKD